MKIKVLQIFLIAVLCSLLQGKSDKYRGPAEDDVIQLDPNTYESIVYQSQQTWFIDLYAEWCGHCQTLRPEWAKFATKMKGIAKVAKLDPSDNKYRPHFYKTYGLEGFPRIIMIPAGI